MAQRTPGSRARALIFLVVSLGAAAAAAFVIWQVFQSYDAQLQDADRPDPTLSVVRAKQTVYPGQTLTAEMLETVPVPASYVYDEVIFNDVTELIGRVPGERIVRGEYIRTERLAAKDAGVGLNAIIPKGLRAVSINVTNASAVSGFLNPGNFVDVLTSLNSEEKKVDLTITMLQARKVLAVNSRMGSDAGVNYQTDRKYAPSVTLAVTPAEAEKLAHASAQSSLTLTLRNDIDVEPVKNEPIDSKKLIGQIDKPAAPVGPVKRTRPISELPKPKEADTITIIRANRQTVEKVSPDGSTHLR